MRDSDQTLPPDPERTTVGPGGAAEPHAGSLPERIGRYRPLRVLGRGGMGVVYEAEQEEPRRRVALKVIRPELATPELRRRFAHESVFLGRLQHPGIAQIYEAGTADTDEGPLPFIAMELVDGVPMHAWAATAQPSRPERLEFMIRLCDAVHHAHQRGLIHRDLKPANVLVDGRGRPRVLDFGVARPADADLETSLVTTHGELVGTVAYMSPEQLAGDPNDLDTRSDVYTLGVMLYELLAGKPPLQLTGRPLEQALRAIREDEPPLLAEHDATLAGDLSVIAAKAMEKERDQRYASANGLAMDLQRHLDDQPISAQPPSTLYLLRKFTRRHRPLVLGAAGMVAALVLGVVGSTWQAVRATRAEQLAATRLEQSEAVTGFLQDMLLSVRPKEARGREVTVREVLDRAAGDLDGGSLAAQPAVEAALRQTLGSTYGALGLLDDAGHHAERGLALADSLWAPSSPQRLRLVLDVARNQNDRGFIERAEDLVRQATPLLPADGEQRATALGILADVRYTQGAWVAADSLMTQVVALARAASPVDSMFVARALLNQSFVAEEMHQWDRALDLIAQAEAIYLAVDGPDSPQLISVAIKRGDALRSQGKMQDAIAVHTAGLEAAEAIYDPGHIELANLHWRLGMDHYGAAQYPQSESHHLEALRIRRDAYGHGHRDVALSEQSLAQTYRQMGRLDDAHHHNREALRIRQALFGPTHAAVIASWQDIALLHQSQGELAEAESLLVHVEDLFAQQDQPVGDQGAINSFYLGMILQAQGRHADAEVHFRRSVERRIQQYGEVHSLVAQARSNLATNLFRQGRKSEAADEQAAALAMSREVGPANQHLLSALGNAAYLLSDAGRHEEAGPLYEEYIDLAGKLYGGNRPEQSSARGWYADNLLARGRLDEAEDQARQLKAWREEHLPADDSKRYTANAYLIDVMLAQGRVVEAEQLLAETEAGLVGLTMNPRQQRRLDATRGKVEVAVTAAR